MNKYTKPTFMLASLGVNALAASAGSCSYVISEAEKEDFDIMIPGWRENGFHAKENCTIHINAYCKFTSGTDGETNVLKAFSS